MSEECLICGAPLEYLDESVLMECALCHEKTPSSARCEQGHFVCDACHEKGVDVIVGICLRERSADPREIFEKLASQDFCHMHGPEHHIMVGASLLTAYANEGGTLDLEGALLKMLERGKSVPGGICGFWGACGAAISTGIFVSIALGATPLSEESWGLANQMTSRALARIGEVGGPRCCKRNGNIALREAVAFTQERLGVQMVSSKAACTRMAQNAQCIGGRCPFFTA